VGKQNAPDTDVGQTKAGQPIYFYFIDACLRFLQSFSSESHFFFSSFIFFLSFFLIFEEYAIYCQENGICSIVCPTNDYFLGDCWANGAILSQVFVMILI